MNETMVLGIDAGGTHTDAALITGQGAKLKLAAAAKVATRHEDLAASVRDVLAELALVLGSGGRSLLGSVQRVTWAQPCRQCLGPGPRRQRGGWRFRPARAWTLVALPWASMFASCPAAWITGVRK